ncbi:MAG: SRPBCC family protein [Planctomycetes bacterium]|nr:SRPBCC family protein [Planctomycetota bacterium]
MTATRDTADRELVVTRDFDAPRALVFDAWTDGKHLANWWGPNGFTTTTHAIDVRPGGRWRFVMHGPDGRDYQNLITYLEVVRPERLVYRHGGGEAELEGVTFQSTVTFEEVGGKTRVTMRLVFPTAAERDRVVREYGAEEGGRQTLARLAEYVAADRTITSSRVFDAPRERVFAAFGDPEQLRRWWGPNGFTNTCHEFDLRPGGAWRHVMHGPDGTDYPNAAAFVEVAPPARVAFDHLDPVHGFRMTMTFDDEAGKTRLTWRMVFASAEEAGRVRGFVVPANEQNFDRLAAHLAAN